jgi:hypothetical protein
MDKVCILRILVTLTMVYKLTTLKYNRRPTELGTATHLNLLGLRATIASPPTTSPMGIQGTVVESTVSALISRAMTLHPCCGHLFWPHHHQFGSHQLLPFEGSAVTTGIIACACCSVQIVGITLTKHRSITPNKVA